jgi:AcrR family transcriptional regulator
VTSPPRDILNHELVKARRHEARKHEIVERVLPVVEHHLQRAGSYAALRLEDVFRDALLSRSTFYRYFRDRCDLLLALIPPVLEDVRRAAIRPFDRDAAPTLVALQAELRRNFDIYRPHIPLLNALAEASYSTPRVSEQFERGFDEVRSAIAERLANGQRAGFVRPELLPDETAAWITWMAERGMSRLVSGADPERVNRLAESLAAMVWHAVYLSG